MQQQAVIAAYLALGPNLSERMIRLPSKSNLERIDGQQWWTPLVFDWLPAHNAQSSDKGSCQGLGLLTLPDFVCVEVCFDHQE